MRLHAVIALVLATAAAVRAGETCVVVGEGWLYAREQMEVELTNATQLVALERIPAEADLSSLLVFPRNSPVELLDWRSGQAGLPEATIRTDGPGRRSFDAAYLVRGPSWRASYQLIVRADPANDDAPVSVDIEGRVTVQNHGGASWTNARVRLVGATRPRSSARRDHGVLVLDDHSPLSDLWLKSTAEESRDHAYEFERPVHLRANEERSYTFVSAVRRPAARRYVLDSDDIPSGGAAPGKPLRRVIAIPNDPEHGLGRDLPGGTAQIFLGSVRGTLGETAWFDRTPAGGEIRIELGRTELVSGLRRAVSSEPGAPGEINEQFEIVVRNALTDIARIEVTEEPPVQRGWDIIRSNQPYEIRNRRIRFQLDVPAGETSIIRYTTRSHEPRI